VAVPRSSVRSTPCSHGGSMLQVAILAAIPRASH
jgi:hypothetical protein